MSRETVDAVIVGAGASGGVVAHELAHAGLRVVMLERGPQLSGNLLKTDWPSVAAKDFFRMIRDHTLQGAYSHPKYGGNRNKAAWDMIGYDDFWVE